MKDLRFLLFDLDGTLIDSGLDIASAVNRLLQRYELPLRPNSEIISYVGRGVRILLTQVFATTGLPKGTTLESLYQEFVGFYDADLDRHTRLYPGVLDTLTTLASSGCKMAVCTNKPQILASPLLQRLGLSPFFVCLVGGDTLPVRKPDPAPLLYALDALGASASEAWMIGDSTYDILAGKAARLRTCAVTYGYQPTAILQAESPDALIHSFPDLLPLVGISPPSLSLSSPLDSHK